MTAVRTGSTEAVSESLSRRRINSTRTSVRTVRRVATAWSPPNSSPTGGAPSSNDSSTNYRYSTIPPPSPPPPPHSMVTTKLITDRGRTELKRLINQLQVQYHTPVTPPQTTGTMLHTYTVTVYRSVYT